MQTALEWALDAASSCALLVDEQGRIVHANARSEATFGYPRSALIGQSLGILLVDPAKSEIERRCAALLGASSPRIDVTLQQGRRRDGSELPATLRLELVSSPGERPLIASLIEATEPAVAPQPGEDERLDSTLRTQAEQQLRNSLREKEMLLREIHHRVKNNLQIISSLLNMKADSLDDDLTQEVFADCQARIQSLAFVHEHLYVSADLSHVPFAAYARTLVEHLKLSCRRPGLTVTTHVDIDDIDLSIDDAIPCGLIVNELVTNALKHAFPVSDKGSIELSMRRVGSAIELLVKDDGRGLPDEREPHGSGTLGLDLVYTFAEQLRATVQITRSPGTCFAFRFTPGSTARASH